MFKRESLALRLPALYVVDAVCKASSLLLDNPYISCFKESLETSMHYVGQTHTHDCGKALELLHIWRARGWFGNELFSRLESVMSDSSGDSTYSAKQLGAGGNLFFRAISESLASAESTQLRREVSDLRCSGQTKAETIMLMKRLFREDSKGKPRDLG